MNRRKAKEIVIKAIWDWLHGSHKVNEGLPDEYEQRNANIFFDEDINCVGVDDQIDLERLADFVAERLEANKLSVRVRAIEDHLHDKFGERP